MKTTDFCEIKEIAPGTFMLLEGNLDAIYLLTGTQRALLVDTGIGITDLKGWVETQTALPYDVLLTHGHVDHAGGAGQFSRAYSHPADAAKAANVTLAERQSYVQRMIDYGSIEAQQLPAKLPDYGPVREMLPVTEGDSFELGARKIHVLHTPGHTPGSLCLWDEATQLLFSGDSLQSLQLLLVPGPQKRQVLEAWCGHVERLLALVGNGQFVLGGHGRISINKVRDLAACGRELLEGSIQPVRQKLYFFDAPFARHGEAAIFLGDDKEVFP